MAPISAWWIFFAIAALTACGGDEDSGGSTSDASTDQGAGASGGTTSDACVGACGDGASGSAGAAGSAGASGTTGCSVAPDCPLCCGNENSAGSTDFDAAGIACLCEAGQPCATVCGPVCTGSGAAPECTECIATNKTALDACVVQKCTSQSCQTFLQCLQSCPA